EVPHPGRAEGATVAHAVTEDPPREDGRPLVLPHRAEDLKEVMGLRLPEAEGAPPGGGRAPGPGRVRLRHSPRKRGTGLRACGRTRSEEHTSELQSRVDL